MNDRILWGQIIIVLTIVTAAVWTATQWTAGALGFQPALGAPWFRIDGYPVYPPPAFFWWWFAFDAYAPPIFYRGAAIAASGGFLSIIVAIAMSVWRARERRRAETYGSARWASEREIRKAGMLGADGVILGRFARQYLRHDGAEHVLCFAPTRSGKGVGLVVPTLLSWPGSCIVHDIKGENWQLTAGFRALHGRVLLFDPTNAKSAAYNPLLEVRRGEWEVRDVQNVADVLVDPEGSLEKRNHWEKTSHALLVGAILHVLYAEEEKTLAGVAAFLSDPRRPIEATLYRMKQAKHLGDRVHPVVAAAAQELLNKSENERSGVLSTAMSFLGLYRDPVIAKVTGSSQWRIADLMGGDTPVSLYLVVPPGDISRTKPLIRLILNQIGRRLTEELNPAARPRRLLLMLDEFPALGRLDFFESALAFMAGYGIKAFLIAQSLNQIEKAYGLNNAILDNCHVRVSFATNDERTAKRISDAPADGEFAPTDPQIAFHLARFIEHVRSIPADPVVLRRDWLSAYDFATTSGAQALNDYARTNDPFAEIGKRQVAVDVSSVIRASKDSFRIAWTERRYQDGSLLETSRWSAIVTVTIQPPRTADALRTNPLGVFVSSLNWSKELSQ